MARDVQAGKPTADEHEALSAKLGVQLSQYGIDPEPIIKQFQIMAENGVASATHLADAFIKLVPTLKGNADGAVKLVARFADVEAATGITADSLTSLMGRIESTGEVDSKIIKQLEKKNIPIMRELASIYGTDAAGVNELAKAHEIGVEQMQTALLKTTEMYAGTAAALSATTEGSKASMEAAIGRAKESAAASANEVMKAYYNERQARMDMLAASAEYQAQMRAEGQIVGEVDVALLKLKDAWGAFLTDCIKWLDDIGMLKWFTGDDKTITERLDDRAVDKYDTITNSYKNIGDSKYYKRDEVEADLQGLQDAVAWMEKQGIAYDTDELAAVKGSMEALIAALTDSEKAAQEQAKAATEQAAASKEQAKAAKKAADEQAKASAAGKDIWARKLMQGNASADEVAKAFGFSDAGFGNSAQD